MQTQEETSAVSISDTFGSETFTGETLGLLPSPAGRLTSFVESLALNVILASLLLWFTMAHLPKASPAPRYVNELVFLKRLPPKTSILHIKLRPPIRVLVKPSLIEAPKPQPQAPKPVTLKTPPMPVIPLPPAKVVVAAAHPRVGVFATPKATSMANSSSTPAIKAGGFGDPSGVAVNPNATRPATIAAISSFNNTPGANLGTGAAHGDVVKAGGFGSGVGQSIAGAGGLGNGEATVATGGFAGDEAGSGSIKQTVQPVNMTPPQVLSEPHPRYTEEAKLLKIQGEITLQVRFGVNGKVEVLRVVRGLGHGLDEEARRVAEQIQFKPAARNGQPADDVTYIHILFQLA
jgi:TonB family protein